MEYTQEDEIDLRELWVTLLKYKYKIVIFTIVVTFFGLVYTLSLPNSYKSYTLLAPQETKTPSLAGELAAMMSGISYGAGNLDAFTSLKAILSDYSFNKAVIEKNGLVERINSTTKEKNYLFAFGYDGVYSLLHPSDESVIDERTSEQKLFNAYRYLQGMLSISSDKKTSLITLSATSNDRFFAKEIVEIYLVALTEYLEEMEIIDATNKIKFYKQELASTKNIELRKEISSLISALVQKRVLSSANEYYIVSQMIAPRVAFASEKTGPKRKQILMIIAMMSLMLGVFSAFLKEFIGKSR